MTPEEIQAMAKGLAEGQALWYLLSAVAGGLITGAVAYLTEKSKNVATKEDIEGITRQVEEVKAEYVRQIEDLKAHHQLRMVAAEKRLDAHQEAYRWWVLLMGNILQRNTVAAKANTADSQRWFAGNCLFLTPGAREAVQKLWVHVIRDRHCEEIRDDNAKDANYQEMQLLGNVFLNEVNLPVLNQVNLKGLSEVQSRTPA